MMSYHTDYHITQAQACRSCREIRLRAVGTLRWARVLSYVEALGSAAKQV
jgi:hypothetical protein